MKKFRDTEYGVPSCSVMPVRPLARAALASPCGISLMITPKRFTGAITRRCAASQARPPQWNPPIVPGTSSEPRRLGGVKMPS